MRKVAVFGNTGGGKSTLARKLADLTRLPLYAVDIMQFPEVTGAVPREVPHEEYLKAHAALLTCDAWIIDGYGCRTSAWERFAAADTLIYIDLPLFTHFLWVTKRLVAGIFVTPAGWPARSPMLKSSMRSYRVLWLCHKHLTPKYRELVAEAQHHKRVHHLRSPSEITAFLKAVSIESKVH